ncbi:hypothetical protein BV25DRAFT_1530772 [Artomyces pyxidatus]|uniref:Uncharacterized protein n=1 Tax=Artomyces pyxidatus TaxID=48021 RepID=A0ACB8TDD0_9AGAM|nr:hypothetical protein BV25DRAFT_1530772 [Artomyces pyxidatus]
MAPVRSLLWNSHASRFSSAPSAPESALQSFCTGAPFGTLAQVWSLAGFLGTDCALGYRGEVEATVRCGLITRSFSLIESLSLGLCVAQKRLSCPTSTRPTATESCQRTKLYAYALVSRDNAGALKPMALKLTPGRSI